jgi:hypothetical protein
MYRVDTCSIEVSIPFLGIDNKEFTSKSTYESKATHAHLGDCTSNDITFSVAVANTSEAVLSGFIAD